MDTPEGIAKLYAGLVQYFVLDRADSAQVPEIERLGLNPVTCDLLDSTELARTLADLSVSVPPSQQVSAHGSRSVDHPRLAVPVAGLELAAENLPVGVLWNLTDEIHGSGFLVIGQPLADEPGQGFLGDGGARARAPRAP